MDPVAAAAAAPPTTATSFTAVTRQQVLRSLPAPWRYKPPSTKPRPAPRSSRAGIGPHTDCVVVGTGAGVTVASALELDLRPVLVHDPDKDALSVSRSIVHRKCRHSQCRFHLALPDPEQLPPFDALIVNASSFRGQAKSTVSPLFHESAAHLLWTAGALATCQPTWASLELPSHLKDMQGGDVWRALEALFDAAGYLLHLQRACASWWQATETRKRAWALLLRKDAFPSLGFPAPLPMPTPKPRRLQDILSPAVKVEHMFDAHRLYVEINGLSGRWAEDFDDLVKDKDRTLPTVAFTYGDGGWGNKVYVHATPAHRHQGPDPGGNSHLVAQKRADGAFAIRRRTEREVYKALSGWHFDLEHPVRPSHRRASELYGLSSNVDMQLGVLGHWLRHLRPS